MTGNPKKFDAIKFASGLRDYIGKAIRPLAERVTALEARETKTMADLWHGSWQPNNRYSRGALVTHAGSLWIAVSDTSDKPGSGSGAWRLCVKGQA